MTNLISRKRTRPPARSDGRVLGRRRLLVALPWAATAGTSGDHLSQPEGCHDVSNPPVSGEPC
jgi:hypothetical protein